MLLAGLFPTLRFEETGEELPGSTARRYASRTRILPDGVDAGLLPLLDVWRKVNGGDGIPLWGPTDPPLCANLLGAQPIPIKFNIEMRGLLQHF